MFARFLHHYRGFGFSATCTLAACFGTASAPSFAGPVTFVDVSTERGIGAHVSEEGHGTGVALADFDNDGFVDMFVPQAAGVANLLYHNLGNGSFEEIAGDVGLALTATTRVALWIDYDADGRLDLFTANDDLVAPSSFTLYRQQPNGTFVDVTMSAGVFKAPTIIDPEAYHRGGICAGDINNDGYIDIYTGQWFGPGHLFLNNGDGSFSDISDTSGVSASNWGHQPVMADFNSDGWLDIYLAVDFDPNVLWINQQNNTFVNLAIFAGIDNTMNDMGLSLGDYDNDGDPDVYITNIYMPPDNPLGFRYNVLYQNNTTGGIMSFLDVSESMAVHEGYFGWGTTFMDADRDGDLDLAATNGWRSGEWVTDPSRFFMNNQAGTLPFSEASAEVQFDDTFWGSALVAADFDRDGDLDLVQACMDGPLRLLDNQAIVAGASNSYLVIKPRSIGPNRFSIGAKVVVQVGGQTMTRWIGAGTSYMGQEPAEAFFGLGPVDFVDEVSVHWPDGTVTAVENVAANQVLTLYSQGTPVPAASQWGVACMFLALCIFATAAWSGRSREAISNL